MPKETKVQPSVIEVIQKMVAEGRPEQEIIQTLKDLGVEPEKAKRLLLIGQADTFAILRGEIAKIVMSEIEEEKPRLENFIMQEAEKAGQKTRELITTQVMQDIRKYEMAITGQSKTFQEQIQDTVRKVTELSDRVKDSLNELGEIVEQMRLDLDEMKVRGVGLRNKFLSLALIVLGVAFLLTDLYLFLTKFIPAGAVMTPDTLIIAVILGMAGITMMFVSTAL